MTSEAHVLPPLQVVRVAPAPAPDGATADYADSFVLRLLDNDGRTAEEWARAGLEQAPAWMRWAIVVAHRGVLQFRAAAAPDDQILGWRITSATPDEVRLDTAGPLASATMLAQRHAPTIAGITTYLYYRHPSMHHVWRALGPVHRHFAPRLLTGAARRFGHPSNAGHVRTLDPLPADAR